jgi:Flp pilus assembly protein TadD
VAFLVAPACAQSIIPAHPDAKGGGNPLQGLGRKDDPYPARYQDYLPKNETTREVSEGSQTPAPTEESEAGKSETTRANEGNADVEVPTGSSKEEVKKNIEESRLEEPLLQDGAAATRSSSESQKKDVAPDNKNKPSPVQVTDRIREALAKHAYKSQNKPGHKQQFVPPPPLNATNTSTPERQALSMIDRGDYEAAEERLRELVSTDPLNLHARYLLAVALVHRKKYDEARLNYRLILQKAQDQKLIDMAEQGLRKLER